MAWTTVLGVLAAGCGGPPDDVPRVSLVNAGLAGPPGSVVTGFSLLATGSVSVDDRTQILGGDVGAAGVGIAASLPTVVVGASGSVDHARVVIGQRVVLRDGANVGAVRATTITAPTATFTSLSPFAAPPAVPQIRTVTPGAAPVTVAVGQTSQLAAGRFGAVAVHGTLELTGGLYELASLSLDNDARLVARARSVVRIAQGLQVLDRVHISVVAPLGASDLRFTVAGTNPGTTTSASLGNDATVTALFLASAALTAGDRFIFTGVVAARNVTIGHDGKLTFQAGFDCNADLTCADTSVCTTDSCTDGQCLNVPLPNGTACSDGNACTQTDACQAGVCVGTNPKVCTALDQCHVVGTCAPATGICSNPNATNGTACNDGNACTPTDSCQSGACVGMNAKVCTALDQCHVAGTCAPATGVCSTPNAADGTPCNDALACTLGDGCLAGACVGTAQICTTPAQCDQLGSCAVTPVLNCVLAQDDGTFIALYGYNNGADVAVPIGVGASNQFSPGTGDRGQPTSFTPGSRDFWVSVPFDGTPLTWTLGGTTATASASSPACPPFTSGGDDDTEGSGDLVKQVPLPAANTPDPTLTPKVASDNLFPLVTVPVVDHPETAMAQAESAPDTLELIDVGLGAQATTRYTEVVLVNSTSQVLSFVEGEFQGAAVWQPPSGISPVSYGHWQSKNGKALQGTGGHMTYALPDGTQVKVTWDNPFIGANSYDSTLSGAGAGSFAVDRVGGGGNQATVFFVLRPITTAATNCPFGTHQWAVDALHSAQPPLSGFATATGFVTTPLKNITEIGKWEGTGCLATRVVGRVVATAHSTDRFFTIDVVLDEFDGAFLTDSGKAVRIEVGPAGTLGLTTNPAHEDLVDNGLPALGSRIVFSGRLLIDHGSFLEVHPSDPIQAAKPCDQFAPGDPLPLYCNKTLNDFFTWDTGQPPTPMGRAEENRACFLTAMSGEFQVPADEIHALIDPATNNWFLTGTAGTTVKTTFLSGFFADTPTAAEAAAQLGIDVANIIQVFPPVLGLVAVEANFPQNLHAEARCITTKALTAEATWNQGDAPVPVGNRDDACFLTRIAGHFAGAGESVGILDPAGGTAGTPTRIGGSSGEAGVSASGRCSVNEAANTDFGVGWNQGTASMFMEFLDDFPACFLKSVAGHFDGRGEEVQIKADTSSNGRLFWELGGLSQQSGVSAGGQCIKP